MEDSELKQPEIVLITGKSGHHRLGKGQAFTQESSGIALND